MLSKIRWGDCIHKSKHHFRPGEIIEAWLVSWRKVCGAPAQGRLTKTQRLSSPFPSISLSLPSLLLAVSSILLWRVTEQTQSRVCWSERGVRGRLWLQEGPWQLADHINSLRTATVLNPPVIVRRLTSKFCLIGPKWYFSRPIFGPREGHQSRTTIPHRTPLSFIFQRNLIVGEVLSGDHSSHEKVMFINSVHISLKLRPFKSLLQHKRRHESTRWSPDLRGGGAVWRHWKVHLEARRNAQNSNKNSEYLLVLTENLPWRSVFRGSKIMKVIKVWMS